ncbi:cryptochrome/photolyase family protein [Amphibacillus cookii]|uniref:cryptochrome/photolyase family protein n=1 Tax=Amphibacillus cookii TaxID=767787 RepID=UPI00195A47D2|nr:deoxyribodipyrimidine photo-lyase [Amphibacillus cookii]MBM7540986.1 deoxyribodipyrimidine photo-lyase [Amphibacillus cookii]
MKRILVLFRNDLRTNDHPALNQAGKDGEVLPVYITHARQQVHASDWFLHYQLIDLKQSLRQLNLPLLVVKGDTVSVLQQFVDEFKIEAIYLNQTYIETAYEGDQVILELAKKLAVQIKFFQPNTLVAFHTILTNQNQHYKVFTPFWKRLIQADIIKPTRAPASYHAINVSESSSQEIEQLNLLKDSDWTAKFEHYWKPGETYAHQLLEQFINHALPHYNEKEYPSLDIASRLSPYIAVGAISPRVIWDRIVEEMLLTEDQQDRIIIEKQGWAFLRQLAWRDFAYQQLAVYPDAKRKALKENFNQFPWLKDHQRFDAWKKGETGYPLVDAGMRELWETGWINNRVRMVVASFLVKHLRIDWRWGQAWFEETLIDHDQANNVLGWQWVTGSGFDAAPYFRVFNPIRQAEKFDPDGTYIKQWLPELTDLPIAYVHHPSKAPKAILEQANLEWGQTYPAPLVEHDQARKQALAAYDMIKESK